MFRFKSNKVDNAHSGWRAKVAIRTHVLEALTPERANVFDAFAGTGLMWREVWHRAAAYTGCDERWHSDTRCCFVADNRRVLRAIDLAPFTCFDLDAYGSPWEQAIIIAARRPPLVPGDRLGLVLTEGTSIKSTLGAATGAMMQAAGLARNHVRGATRLHDEIIQRAVQGIAARMGGKIVKHWQATGLTGARMRYVGLVIEPDPLHRPSRPVEPHAEP